jgi:HEPN domain-containing protein
MDNSQALQFPKTHDLVALANLLEKRLEMPEWAAFVGDLNDYAVATRYPGDYTPITTPEYESAVGLARTIVDWASSMLENP